jgi:phage terminase large subunit
MNYAFVPKPTAENLLFRKRIILRAEDDVAFRRQMWNVCRRDILFWLNTFCWTYDPRKGETKRLVPFLTWPFQDEAVLSLKESLGKECVLVEKSRDMGASWLILALFTHAWQFEGMGSYGLASSTEALVDAPHNPKSLFWKVDKLLECQPRWLVPPLLRQKLLLKNLRTGSTMDGTATTADMFRGDRRTAILMDEFAAFEPADAVKANAAAHAASDCRIFNSTYQGAAGMFYDLSISEMKKISMHWARHPEKSKGLYYDAKGKARSPWYDQKCKELIVPAMIACELDMDPVGSASQFFPAELIERCIALDTRNPYHVGRVEGGVFVEAAA